MATIIPATTPKPNAPIAYNGTDWTALLSDAARHLQVDVVASGIPTGAATAANQATEITALQLIDDLRGALQSVATDRLRVRGENQLFSLEDAQYSEKWGTLAAANWYIDTAAVPAGKVWVITTICTLNNSRATTNQSAMIVSGAGSYRIAHETRAFGVGDGLAWSGHIYLRAAAYVRVYFIGGVVGDSVRVYLTGYLMTKEA